MKAKKILCGLLALFALLPMVLGAYAAEVESGDIYCFTSQDFAAVQRRQRLHDLDDLEAGQPVVDVLALAACADEAFIAQHAQLLRQAGLVQTDQRFQLADIALALCELAEQQQAVFMRHGFEYRACLGSRVAQHGDGRFGERHNVGRIGRRVSHRGAVRVVLPVARCGAIGRQNIWRYSIKI